MNNMLICSEIELLLPQRYPFLLLDKIFDYELNRYAKGIKNVAKREPLLVDKDSGFWPGAFVIESLGQLAIALINLNNAGQLPPKILLGNMAGITFHSPIPMGCRLDLFIQVEKYMEGASFVASGYADVDNERKVTINTLVAKILEFNH